MKGSRTVSQAIRKYSVSRHLIQVCQNHIFRFPGEPLVRIVMAAPASIRSRLCGAADMKGDGHQGELSKDRDVMCAGGGMRLLRGPMDPLKLD